MLFRSSGTDGDDASYVYPSAATTANDKNLANIKTGWQEDGSYSYTPNLSGLIKSVDLNLFNNYEYWPYFAGAQEMSKGAGKISAKVTLDKDAYNELILMVDCIVMNLMKAIGDDNEPYIADVAKAGKSLANAPIDGIGTTNEYKNFFNGLDELVKRNATTQEKVDRKSVV